MQIINIQIRNFLEMSQKHVFLSELNNFPIYLRPYTFIGFLSCCGSSLKAGVNPKAVFWLGIMFLMQISRLRFKQSRISMLISHSYVLGCFVNFWVIFRYIWREIVFLKGLVELVEIGNFEDLLLF